MKLPLYPYVSRKGLPLSKFNGPASRKHVKGNNFTLCMTPHGQQWVNDRNILKAKV
jgi:hypothetical protein